MTGRPGYRTMEMIGGSSTSYLARTPCVPLFSTLFSKPGNRRAFRLRGAGAGSFPLCSGTFARSYPVPISAILSRPIRANRFSLWKHFLFANRPSKIWDSSKDWTRIMRISMRIGEKTRFARIWPSVSKIEIFLWIDSRESAKRWCANRLPTKVPHETHWIPLTFPGLSRIVLRKIKPVTSFGGLFWGSKMAWNSRIYKKKLGEKDKSNEKEEAGHTTKTATILWRFLLAAFHYLSRAPRCGSGPNCRLENPPHPPHLQLEDPSLTTALPSPPSPSLFPPTPLALFVMLREGAAQAGVGEGSLSRKGWRGRAVQAALGARPTSGGAQIWGFPEIFAFFVPTS